MTTTYSNLTLNSKERQVIKILRQVDVQSVSSIKSQMNCWQKFITLKVLLEVINRYFAKKAHEKLSKIENSHFPGFFEIAKQFCNILLWRLLAL